MEASSGCYAHYPGRVDYERERVSFFSLACIAYFIYLIPDVYQDEANSVLCGRSCTLVYGGLNPFGTQSVLLY